MRPPRRSCKRPLSSGHATGARRMSCAAAFILAGLMLVAGAGCGSSQQLTEDEHTTFVRQELDRWRTLRQRMVGNAQPTAPYTQVVRNLSGTGAPSEITIPPPKVALASPSEYSGQINPTTSAPHQATPSSRDVFLRPGDVLEVKFFYTPELNVTQMVRPDGKIALQLVDEVNVEGKTPAQVREMLLRLYQPHLKDPKITVLVQSLYDRRIFVAGQVTRPGIVEMPGDMTVMEAIMEAGGFNVQEAKIDSVLVIRQENNRWRGYKLDTKPMLEGRGAELFYLRPRDIVYVPRTKIAVVDQWIDQHINKLIPRLPFYFSMPLQD